MERIQPSAASASMIGTADTSSRSAERQLATLSQAIRELQAELLLRTQYGEVPSYAAAPELHDRLDELTNQHIRLAWSLKRMRAWRN